MAVPVLHRQTPACKRHHLPAMSQVEVIEWCPAEYVLRVAGFRATSVPASTLLPPPPPKLAPCPGTLDPTCAQLSGRPRADGSACSRKPSWATMLTARCIVARSQCSRHSEATTLPGTLGDVVPALLGQVCLPQRGSEGAGSPKGGQPQRKAAQRAGGAFKQCAVTPICRETAPGSSS